MTKFGSDKIRKFGSDEGRARIEERRARVAEIRGEDEERPRGRRGRSAESVELPTLDKLERKLKRITDSDEVKAMQAADDRKGAQELYEARLAELEGGE